MSYLKIAITLGLIFGVGYYIALVSQVSSRIGVFNFEEVALAEESSDTLPLHTGRSGGLMSSGKSDIVHREELISELELSYQLLERSDSALIACINEICRTDDDFPLWRQKIQDYEGAYEFNRKEREYRGLKRKKELALERFENAIHAIIDNSRTLLSQFERSSDEEVNPKDVKVPLDAPMTFEDGAYEKCYESWFRMDSVFRIELRQLKRYLLIMDGKRNDEVAVDEFAAEKAATEYSETLAHCESILKAEQSKLDELKGLMVNHHIETVSKTEKFINEAILQRPLSEEPVEAPVVPEPEIEVVLSNSGA